MVIPNKLEFLIGLYGTIYSGYVPIPLNSNLPITEISKIFKTFSPKCLITNQEFYNLKFVNENNLFEDSDTVLSISLAKKTYSKNSKIISFYPSFKGTKHNFKKICPDDEALILFTSGTSGIKKGVVLTHRNLIQTTKYMNKIMGITEEITEFITSPLTHSFGLSRTRSVLMQGGKMILKNGNFNPKKTIELSTKFCCNAISGVSTIFSIFVKNFSNECFEIGSNIKWIEVGGMPLPREHVKKILKIFPESKFVMNYGLTEAMKSTIIDFRNNVEKINTVGKPAPGIKIKIMDYEGNQLKKEKVGIITISGPNIAKSYFNNDHDWKKRFQDGWLTTEDVGYFDRDGYLSYLGRKDELINVGGYKFHPIEVEYFLNFFFKKSSFIVCGIPDPQKILGEVPIVCIENNSNHNLQNVIKYLEQKVEKFKIPKYIFHFEKFPTTDNGKIRRNEIQEIVKNVFTKYQRTKI